MDEEKEAKPGAVELEAYLPEFLGELRLQLREDDKRWGSTWKNRPREGQEIRVFQAYDNYFDQYLHAHVPIPWLKVVGNAFIAWLRENHEELFNG